MRQRSPRLLSQVTDTGNHEQRADMYHGLQKALRSSISKLTHKHSIVVEEVRRGARQINQGESNKRLGEERREKFHW